MGSASELEDQLLRAEDLNLTISQRL
ncbi:MULTISPECIES: hypothetical protein [unclassified Moorena]|nr:hypothetical protein [Moorena sp. SIO3B2]NER87871.1 hypothetical protein [Moorena sp. SIO3A2]